MNYKSIFRGEKAIGFFLLFVLCACSPNTIDKEAPAINDIRSGEKFTIILPENHDEGILWKLDPSYNRSVTDNLGAVWHGNEKGVYFRFQSLSKGTDTLVFTQFKTDAATKERDSIKSSVYIVRVTD